MAAGRTVEPIAAILALLFGKPLLFFALGAFTIHLAIFHIVGE
jgi:hypothetical protein